MKKILSIAQLALLTMGVANAQTADAIAKKYVEAIGGAAKWKAVKSMKQTINISTQGIDIPGTIVSDAKNRARVDVTAMGSKIVQAKDGITAWWINPFQGATQAAKMPAAVAKEFLAQEFLDNIIDWKKRGSTLTLDGEEKVGDKDCFKLKLVRKDQSEVFYFIAKDNYTLVMSRAKSSAQGTEQTVDTLFSDYEDFGGLLIAKKIVNKTGGAVRETTTIQAVELNVEVTDDMFAFPGN